MRVKDVEKVVKIILTEYPETRGDDFLLLTRVYEKIDPSLLYSNFSYVMIRHKDLGLPAFDSVRRSRQKLQAKHEELRAPERVRKAREEKEEEYIEYARS